MSRLSSSLLNSLIQRAKDVVLTRQPDNLNVTLGLGIEISIVSFSIRLVLMILSLRDTVNQYFETIPTKMLY
jgi:hypothetical protein